MQASVILLYIVLSTPRQSEQFPIGCKFYTNFAAPEVQGQTL